MTPFLQNVKVWIDVIYVISWSQNSGGKFKIQKLQISFSISWTNTKQKVILLNFLPRIWCYKALIIYISCNRELLKIVNLNFEFPTTVLWSADYINDVYSYFNILQKRGHFWNRLALPKGIIISIYLGCFWCRRRGQDIGQGQDGLNVLLCLKVYRDNYPLR